MESTQQAPSTKSDHAWLSVTGSLDLVGAEGILQLANGFLSFTKYQNQEVIFNVPANQVKWQQSFGTAASEIHTPEKTYYINFFNPSTQLISETLWYGIYAFKLRKIVKSWQGAIKQNGGKVIKHRILKWVFWILLSFIGAMVLAGILAASTTK